MEIEFFFNENNCFWLNKNYFYLFLRIVLEKYVSIQNDLSIVSFYVRTYEWLHRIPEGRIFIESANFEESSQFWNIRKYLRTYSGSYINKYNYRLFFFYHPSLAFNACSGPYNIDLNSSHHFATCNCHDAFFIFVPFIGNF